MIIFHNKDSLKYISTNNSKSKNPSISNGITIKIPSIKVINIFLFGSGNISNFVKIYSKAKAGKTLA